MIGVNSQLRSLISVVNLDLKLVTEVCCHCGMVCGLEEKYHSELLLSKETFYFPSGHGQHYTGPSETTRLRQQLDQATADAAWQSKKRCLAEADAAYERRRAGAARGQLTKAKKRTANGVCPCCNRSFVALQRHIAGQHPNYHPEAEA